ncbi:hydrogenase expression/formation C-terminal domain-containing protein [Shigella sonnei]
MAYRWPMNYWHMNVTPTRSHSINLTQLPMSEADRLFSHVSVGRERIQIRTIGYGESYIHATGYAMSGIYAVRTP